MKLWWSKRVGEFEEFFEIEAETASKIIEVYQAIEGEPESKECGECKKHADIEELRDLIKRGLI